MSSLMQGALGAQFEQLPPALKGHYRAGNTLERGHLDIEYPRWMQPLSNLGIFLVALGGLIAGRPFVREYAAASVDATTAPASTAVRASRSSR